MPISFVSFSKEVAHAETALRPVYRRRSAIVVLGLLLWSLLILLLKRFVFGGGDDVPRAIEDKKKERRHRSHSEASSTQEKKKRSKRPSSRLPSMIVLVGIYGSGKTMWAHEYKEKVKPSAVIISSDAIRAQLSGSIEDRTHEDEVRQALLEEVKKNIEECTTFIVDDCENNLSHEFRKALLSMTDKRRINPIIKKLGLKPAFAHARIQRDVAKGVIRYIPTYGELEKLYEKYREAENAIHESEDWFMEKD